MSKIKDSFIDEEPVGYEHVVFSKTEESKLQKYLEEIDQIGNGTDDRYSASRHPKFEIIGNIYENPELLENN